MKYVDTSAFVKYYFEGEKGFESSKTLIENAKEAKNFSCLLFSFLEKLFLF